MRKKSRSPVFLQEDTMEKAASIKAAEAERKFYGKIARIEEIAEFASRMRYKNIGIASCMGLSKEAGNFAEFMCIRGFKMHEFVE